MLNILSDASVCVLQVKVKENSQKYDGTSASGERRPEKDLSCDRKELFPKIRNISSNQKRPELEIPRIIIGIFLSPN